MTEKTKKIIISRDNVSADKIEPCKNPYLKIPVENYLKMIEVDPLPSQIAMINATNRYRFITAALSRRQGKTYIANIIGQLVSLVPGCNVLIMSPNYSLSQISFDLQRQLLKQVGIKPTKDNQKDKVIELENGSTIRMGSVNQADSVVGRSYDLIIFDEAALSDGKEAFEIQLRPTLDRPGSRAIFISTPRGRTNWFHEFWQRGFSDQFPEWCSIKATYEANPRMTQEDIDEAKSTMSIANFKQEYMADFNTYEGQIWTLDPECVMKFDIPTNVDVVAGLDLGFKDYTAMVVFLYSWDDNKYYATAQYKEHEKTTSEYAYAINEISEAWKVDYIYIDSAAQQTRFDFAKEYNISTINAKKSVLDGIGYVSSLLHQKRIIVDPSLNHVLDAFDGFRWDDKENLGKERPMRNEAKHMADAIRYALYSHESSIGIL